MGVPTSGVVCPSVSFSREGGATRDNQDFTGTCPPWEEWNLTSPLLEQHRDSQLHLDTPRAGHPIHTLPRRCLNSGWTVPGAWGEASIPRDGGQP